MSIYFNRDRLGLYNKVGQSAQRPHAARGSPSGNSDSKSTDSVELSGAQEDLLSYTSSASESGLQAVALAQAQDPVFVARSVEEANAIADARLSTRDRKVEFGLHEPSGRITIKITEEHNGSVVERELPPKAFLKLYERLRETQTLDGVSAPKGSLVDFDG